MHVSIPATKFFVRVPQGLLAIWLGPIYGPTDNRSPATLLCEGGKYEYLKGRSAR